MEKFNKYQDKLKNYYNFDVKYKNESLFMKLLSYVLFFNKRFYTDYTTVIGKTIYFPSKEFINKNEAGAAIVLAHELVHIRQKEVYGTVFFAAQYLFPQILSIFAVLSIISLWYLLFLLFLLPLPAPFRKDIEFSGYTATFFVKNLAMEVQNVPLENRRNSLLKRAEEIEVQFKQANYYFAWPFGVSFNKKIEEILSGEILDTNEYYKLIKRVYTDTFGS